MAPKINKVSTTHKTVVSKQAYNVAKSTISTDFIGTLPGLSYDQTNLETGKSVTFQNVFGSSSADGDFDPNATGKSTKQLEEEIMGDTKSRSNQKSHAMEKNLHQMINVLNSRLKALGEVAKIRMKLCEDDVNKDSQNTSKQAPRIGDESDESIPKSLKDMKISNPSISSVFGPSHQKDNLVSAENVFIDPFHLVLRTKGSTEAAKKLESNLEQSFGNLNIREMKSKKSKAMSQSDKSKRTEQLKNDKKRENRQRIEKKLQVAMESFVTRSVMDGDLTFELPDNLSEEPDWPVAVKWCKDDPRSLKAENSDGEFNPDLLLRYSMERITLPSGRALFAWLLKQAVLQRYFVSLFWMIKVKFFESENCEEREAFLLRLLSVDYRLIVELMASRAHAEHEKDFVYKYLPFLLTNAVFFGFYYVFPGKYCSLTHDF
ncbi:hypothetical protein EON65_35090 [archaeon]|nr:MAG: hypothetical protein EON65_35090 [archaeon]